MDKAANRIKELREASGLSQQKFADALGISYASAQRYEYGQRDIPGDVLLKMVSLFGVSSDYILGASDRALIASLLKTFGNDKKNSYTDVPLLSRIAAGKPIEMEDYEDFFPIPTRMHDKYPRAFLLRVEGESMNRIIPNGCYALVNPCNDVEHDGRPYAVCVNGYDATIKRIHKLNNGFELVPDSTDPTYATKTYNFNDPQTQTITIIGEVVYYVLPYDWGF